MHYPKPGPWTHKLLAYSIASGQFSEVEIPRDLGTDLQGCRMAQIGPKIILFKAGEEIQVWEISWLLKDTPVVKQLETLERDSYNFSIAVKDDNRHVFMTGGSGIAGKTAFELDIQANKWKTLPRFTHGRCEHASIYGGDNLYVFGGRDNKSALVGSIEMLTFPKVGNNCAKQWVMLMEDERLVKRENPAICAVGDRKIVVFGGYGKVGLLNDGFLFEEESKQVTAIMGNQQDDGLQTYTQTIRAGPIRYCVLGKGKDKQKVGVVEFIYNTGSPALSEARLRTQYDANHAPRKL